MFGFRPASDGRLSVPASFCARSVDAAAGLLPRVSLVASVLALAFAFFLTPVVPASAATPHHGVQTASFDGPEMSNEGKIGLVEVAPPVSTEVWGKIEAIRRMGARNVLRTSQRHDLILVGVMEKLAESTEIPVRTVIQNGAFGAPVYHGLGRAPPRIDL